MRFSQSPRSLWYGWRLTAGTEKRIASANGLLPLTLGHDQDGPGTSVLRDAMGWIHYQRLAVFRISLQWRRIRRRTKRVEIKSGLLSGRQQLWGRNAIDTLSPSTLVILGISEPSDGKAA